MSDFHRNNSRAIGVQSYCKRCHNRANMRNQVRRRFGISEQEWAEIRERKKSWEMCGKADGQIDLDHNHETGELRGVLCNKCNRGLGFFGDNPEKLRAAANYLDSYWHSIRE